MKWLKALLGKNKEEDGIEYIQTLINDILKKERLYTNEILFRDAVDEIHTQLKRLVIKDGNRDLVEAYEKSVLLKYLSQKHEINEKQLLEEILELIR
ncbi:hypothetical protein [Thermococcus sp.]